MIKSKILKYGSRDFLRFLFVGGVGFVVDAVLLTYFILCLNCSPWLSRISSFLCASAVTWLFNRIYTFRYHVNNKPLQNYARYMFVQLFGAGINFIVFMVAIFQIPGLAKTPVIPLMLGSLCGLLFNYFGARNWVFKTE